MKLKVVSVCMCCVPPGSSYCGVSNRLRGRRRIVGRRRWCQSRPRHIRRFIFKLDQRINTRRGKYSDQNGYRYHYSLFLPYHHCLEWRRLLLALLREQNRCQLFSVQNAKRSGFQKSRDYRRYMLYQKIISNIKKKKR